MAALLKNQLIKRLSKFVKNLSSNQINLSTFKGEGELSSINLDEKALEDVIELPSWLKIQKATCGRVFIKIPWTNLKTLPIQIQLDDVTIEIETCEQLRDVQSSTNVNDPLVGKYGFINRVIDGISLTITNLTFEIKAQGFKASICLPSLDIYSTAPNGKRVETLTLTRLRNATKDHILLFKEISWSNARIQASSNDNNIPGTALRFIANSCRIRIAMKKSIQDSSLVTSRIMINFDDFLSVINDAQFNSALNAYKEITQLMKRASEQKKRKVGEQMNKSERQAQTTTYPPRLSSNNLHEMANPMYALNTDQQPVDAFTRFDIIETSMHFNIKRLDLHIIADSSGAVDRLVENGSIQITIANLSLDHYPYHEFGSSKKHWIKYNEIQAFNRHEWATKLYAQWQEQLNIAKASVPNDDISKKFERALRTNRIRLFESCSVINIDDLVVYPVSLTNDKHQKRRRPLIASDKTYYQVPDTFGLLNIQHTEYYYPLPYSFPVPNSDLYIQVMPILFRVDFATSNWLHAFVSTLSITLDKSGVLKTNELSTDLEHVEIKFEAMLPRIIISSEIFANNLKLQQIANEKKSQSTDSNPQDYETLELSISKVSVTNTRIEPSSDRAKLEEHLALFKKANFFHQNQWPFSTSSTARISPLFEKHPNDTYLYDNPLCVKTGTLPQSQSAVKALQTFYTMTTDSLKKSAKCDIWHFAVESVYIDFTPLPSLDAIRLTKQNLISSLSFNGWAVLDMNGKDSLANVLGVLESPSILKISRKQYTFIMRLVDELGLFFEAIDRNTIHTNSLKEKPSSETVPDEMKIAICLTASTTFVVAVIDDLENATLDLPTPTSSSIPEFDIDSVTPDAPDTTIVDEILTPTPTAPTISMPTRVESPVQVKSSPAPTTKRSKFEENLHRGLEILSKGTRGSSVASSMNMSDNSDDTLSQLDITEDLDAELDASLLTTDLEQQKAARIELDDDCISLAEKKNVRKTATESVSGVFLKINQINICMTEDGTKADKPMYIACDAKYLRIDEFSSLKFDAIKPKLFENENPDEYNNENVPPINIRIDLPKGDSLPPPPPTVTVQVQDRSLVIANHALDVLAQNLEEILTPEEKLIRQNQPLKIVPLDIILKNVQFTLEFLQEYSTTQTTSDPKPPIKVDIEYLHALRQIDGQLIIQKTNPHEEKKSDVNSADNFHEKLRQLEYFRLENERLQSELDAQKVEIVILRRERDSLVNTVSKLDTELTEAEYQRYFQAQLRNK
ncbi:unnamed protein product [Adineta ricciae]|uniref:Chorein N-terminal domain-containing protein n=1 Tax=Adineta ricciae TaxID=249248 RepID=A0A815EPJ4_ADIRI|nr:unnamed protein product [Adineta ricciae]